MSSSTTSRTDNVTLVAGDLLSSSRQTLVNTVNTVGVMGKGIALAFKQRYPEMYADYVERCARNEVRLGQPYVFPVDGHVVLNFPTKRHWRAVSRLSDIVKGLEYLEAHYREWGITSLAVPPLGCGNGQLEWSVVGPTLVRHLGRLDIPVDLYAPAGEHVSDDGLFDIEKPVEPSRIPPEWVAVVAVLDRLLREPYRWPVGRTMLQKLTYFATAAGIDTGPQFSRSSYGPFSTDLKRRLAQLQNNGLAAETPHGRMLEVRVGPAYADAVKIARDAMEPYRSSIDRTVDLMARMSTRDAEVAASVHFIAAEHEVVSSHPATVSEVLDAMSEWKPGRFSRDEVIDAIALLAARGWSRIDVDEVSLPLIEERLPA